jgi:hypothetical protein
MYSLTYSARTDECVRSFRDDSVDPCKEIIIDLLLLQVHPAVRVEPKEGGEAEVGAGDVDELHSLSCVCGFLWEMRGLGVRGES